MTWKRWLFTAASFAAVIGVSIYFFVHWWRAGGAVGLPARAHLWAMAAVVTEVVTRSLKISWGARAARIRLPFLTAVRTTLAGDFGASLTPGRSGAEPTRFLLLSQAGIPGANALVVLYVEIFLEMVSLAFVVLVSAAIFSGQRALLATLGGMVAVYSGIIVGIAVIAVWLARRPYGDALPGWARTLRISDARWRTIERWFAHVRATVERIRTVDGRWIFASFVASVVHVSMRLCVLPALVFGAGVEAPLAPLALWPLALLYGAALVPAPGGMGAVEFTFSRALSGVIGPRYFLAALLWWRFYTFYFYILAGGIAAGRTVMRVFNKPGEVEAEMAAA